MLQPVLQKNDKRAKLLIYTISFVVFAAVVFLSKFKLEVNLGFNVHVFAKVNAVLNSAVTILLLAGLFFAKQKKYELHKRIMLAAILLSVLFFLQS